MKNWPFKGLVYSDSECFCWLRAYPRHSLCHVSLSLSSLSQVTCVSITVASVVVLHKVPSPPEQCVGFPGLEEIPPPSWSCCLAFQGQNPRSQGLCLLVAAPEPRRVLVITRESADKCLEVTALSALSEGPGIRLRAVDDGPLLQTAGGERGAQHGGQAARAAAHHPVPHAPGHLPLPVQLHLQQEPEDQQVGPALLVDAKSLADHSKCG